MSFFEITESQLEELRERFPKGTRVRLIHMDDPYNTKLHSGCLGTVKHVDDAGTVLISWDCGSSLGAVFGEDIIEKVE